MPIQVLLELVDRCVVILEVAEVEGGTEEGQDMMLVAEAAPVITLDYW